MGVGVSVSTRSNKYFKHKSLNGRTILDTHRGFGYENPENADKRLYVSPLVKLNGLHVRGSTPANSATTGNKVESKTFVHRKNTRSITVQNV